MSREMCEVKKMDFHMGVYEKNKGICISLGALLQGCTVTNKSLKMKSDLCIKKMGYLDYHICERFVLMCMKTHKMDINRIRNFKGKRTKNFEKDVKVTFTYVCVTHAFVSPFNPVVVCETPPVHVCTFIHFICVVFFL